MRQNTDAWLEMRKSHIGSSDAPIIMEVSKFKRTDGLWKTPYVLWQEKLDLLPEDKENSAMRWGKVNEPACLERYCKMVGQSFSPQVVFHQQLPYLMASLDGLAEDGKAAVEIKNAGKEDHEMAKSGAVPPHYYPQIQHQMECLEISSLHYFSVNSDDAVIVEVNRDDKYIEEMLKRHQIFWDCLDKFTPPSLTERDYRDQDEMWNEMAETAFYLKQERLALKKQYEEIERKEKSLIKELTDKSEKWNAKSENFRLTLSMRRGNVQYKNIPELKDVNLDSYRAKPIEIWKVDKLC